MTIYSFDRCEACNKDATYVCASLDQPMEYYCAGHYWEHVEQAHQGRELPGSARLVKNTD